MQANAYTAPWSLVPNYFLTYNINDIIQANIKKIQLTVLYSLSSETPYHQILWSLEAARLDVVMIAIVSLKFDRHCGSTTAEMPLKFQSD